MSKHGETGRRPAIAAPFAVLLALLVSINAELVYQDAAATLPL
ncbi:hypothetical protein [Pyrodictium abyssi]